MVLPAGENAAHMHYFEGCAWTFLRARASQLFTQASAAASTATAPAMPPAVPVYLSWAMMHRIPWDWDCGSRPNGIGPRGSIMAQDRYTGTAGGIAGAVAIEAAAKAWVKDREARAHEYDVQLFHRRGHQFAESSIRF